MRNILFWCTLLGMLGLSMASTQAQQTAKRTGWNTGYIGYLEHLPADYGTDPNKKYPVLIFLHGQNERGNGSDTALQVVKTWGPPKHIENGHNMCFSVNGQTECFIVISPQTNDADWYSNRINQVLNHVLNGSDNYQVDPDRIYLTGLSLGAMGIYTYLGSTDPNYLVDQVTAVGIVAGAGNTSTGCTVAERNIPIWHFHGDQDNNTAWRFPNYTRGSAMFNSVINCSTYTPTAEMIFETYTGVGHNAWTRAYRTDNSLHTPNLYQWLLSKSKGAMATAPAAPTNLAAANTTSTSTDLTWSDQSSDELNFELERAPSGGSFTTIATLPANTTTYTDQGLTANTAYDYRIRATNNASNSAYSNTLTVTTPTAPPSGWVAVDWTDFVGTVEDANGDLIKTAGYGWGNGGAASVQSIPANTDGSIRMVLAYAPTTSIGVVFGLSDANVDANRTSIDYGFEIYGEDYATYVNGSRDFYLGKYNQNDQLEIRRVGSTMEFYVNGTLRRTAALTSTPALLVDASMVHNSNGIYQAEIFTSSGSARLQQPQSNAFSLHALEEGSSTTRLFPNPVQSFLHLADVPAQATTLRITDALGRQVVQQHISSAALRLELPQLQPGLYLLHLERATGERLSVYSFIKS